MPDADKPLDPQAAQVVARVRRLLVIASATTFIALAAVLGVIGYRVFHLGGSALLPPPDLAAALPAGARVLSTAIGDGRFAVTFESNGAIRVLLFDLKSLRPLGAIDLSSKP